MGRSRRRLVLVALLLGGCTPARYAADADREVLPLLSTRTEQVLGDRAETILRPAASLDDEDVTEIAPPDQAPDGEPLVTLELDLARSLALATTTGREYLFEKEALYLSGLAVTLQRFSFGPIIDATIAQLVSSGADDGLGTSRGLGATFGLSKILGTGGVASLSLDAGRTDTSGDGVPSLYASNASLSLSQPLLRDAGYVVSHESLTQAQRNLVYSIRAFELFREDFSIDIAADYFDLVSQSKQLVNLKKDFEQSQFDRSKALALRQLDRNEDEDVFLAQRRVIDTESRLLDAQTRYRREVDDFKIRLGLPTEQPVVILDAEPEFVPVRLDADSAVRVALANRVDLHTAADRLQDAERAVQIARNGLLPDADLDLSVAAGTLQEGSRDLLPDDGAIVTAGLSIELPIQRVPERNAYRTAQIARERQRRDYDQLLDQTERVVRDQLRQLAQLETQVGLQELQIKQEQRAVAISEFRYEAGDLDGRDLLDARQALVGARNQLIDLVTSHFILRLRLLRNLGILFIDDKGMWTS